MLNSILKQTHSNNQQQSGAVEARWAHNPEAEGSKPSSAISRLSSVGRAWDCSGTSININIAQ